MIERAARQKGWNPSRLLRVAAVEKAAEILNLEGEVEFDFEGLARELAGRLVRSFRDQPEPAIPAEVTSPESCGAKAAAPSAEWLDLLEMASRYGGRAFLEMVVTRCRTELGGPRVARQDPVDPGQFL